MRSAEPMFSRSGVSSPLGKLTAEIPKVKVPEETHELLEAGAREAGMSLSEFVREVLMVRAHGIDHVRSLHLARLDVVAGSGAIRGRKG